MSPSNYHRFHAPIDFKLEEISHIHGKRDIVNVKYIKDGLYEKNERKLLFGKYINHNNKVCRIIIGLVGAYLVGSIKINVKEGDYC